MLASLIDLDVIFVVDNFETLKPFVYSSL